MSKYAQIEMLLTEGKSSAEIAELVPCSISYANIVKSKLNIVNGTEQMVEHHISYKELSGYDKTVWMTRSEHLKLHQRLRKTGKCDVPVDELTKIATAAYRRTSKSLKSKRDYRLKNTFEKKYWTYMMPYISLKENIGYNTITTNIYVSSGFYGTHKKKPLRINIV